MNASADKISPLAADLEIVRNFQFDAPVNVVSIAKAMGLRVYSVEGWPDNLSGKLKNNRGEFQILVNATHAYVRQRFTIAHELAHYILHRESIGDGISDDALYRSGLSSKMETEANKLAADILMPRELIDRTFLIDKLNTVDQMATKFAVSNSAMSIRLGVPG